MTCRGWRDRVLEALRGSGRRGGGSLGVEVDWKIEPAASSSRRRMAGSPGCRCGDGDRSPWHRSGRAARSWPRCRRGRVAHVAIARSPGASRAPPREHVVHETMPSGGGSSSRRPREPADSWPGAGGVEPHVGEVGGLGWPKTPKSRTGRGSGRLRGQPAKRDGPRSSVAPWRMLASCAGPQAGASVEPRPDRPSFPDLRAFLEQLRRHSDW